MLKYHNNATKTVTQITLPYLIGKEKAVCRVYEPVLRSIKSVWIVAL